MDDEILFIQLNFNLKIKNLFCAKHDQRNV